MVRDSKQTLSVANVSALTLLYTGTGTATAALAANTLTVTRANVNAFTLTYTGSAATCTVAQDADTLTIARTAEPAIALTYIGTAATCTAAVAANTLTIARTAEDAFTLTYTGANPTATVKVVGTTLTYDIGAGDVAIDLTNESYNTIAKVVAALDALDDVTCTLATGAINTNAGTTLNALSVTSIKTALNLDYTPADLTYDLTNGSYDTIAKVVTVLDALDLYTCTLISGAINTNASTTLNNKTATSIKTVLNLTYTPADLTWDLTNASYNTLAEIIAALEALDLYTCTIATGAIGTDASGLLDTLEAASIKTAKVLKYSYADLTYDLTNGSYDTLAELIAVLDAVADLTCTAVTSHTGSASIQLVAFEAASINTALTLTMNYATLTATYNDIGDPIGVKGWDSLALYVKVDINSTNNPRFKFLGKTEADDTDLFLMDHNRIKCPSATVPATEDYIELDSDADQLVEIVIPELYGIAAVQVQVSAGTVGATAGAITAIEYVRTKEG